MGLRVPRSAGKPRRLGLARKACSRMSNSMRCKPHCCLSASLSCQTRRAPYVQSLNKKLWRTWPFSNSLDKLRGLPGLSSHAVESASSEHRTSCASSLPAKLLGVLPQSRTSQRLPCKVKRPIFFQQVALRARAWHSSCPNAQVWPAQISITPWPGKACCGSVANSRTRLRSAFS